MTEHRLISVMDLDIHRRVPVGNPEDWKLVAKLAETAIMLQGSLERRVPIYELQAAGIWKAEWYYEKGIADFAEQEDHSDEVSIVQNEDRT